MRNSSLADIGAIDRGTAVISLDGQAAITGGLQCATEGMRVRTGTDQVR